MYQFKVGDTGKTKDGGSYRVVCDDMKGDYSVVAVLTDKDGSESSDSYAPDGLYYAGRFGPDGSHELDLVPPMQTGFINLYRPNSFTLLVGGVNSSSVVYPTRGRADQEAGVGRVACVEVTYPKG